MESHIWDGRAWFDLLQTAALLVGLFATVHTLREENRSRKLGNAISLTANHREIWMTMIQHPKLGRVLNAKVNLVKHPPTMEEELFVQMLILHLRTALTARKLRLEPGDENFEVDIRDFFQLKIPRAIWERTRVYQGEELARVIDDAIAAGK
jgi:hypothetical protein